MQAARLVDYSDSEDDEEMEWREFHMQRSTLRIPKAGMTRPAPAVVTEERGSAATTDSPGSDRDFAFTPRKRTTFLRSTASASPFTRKSTSPPFAPLSPQVDFSFSPSVSPMSDGETKASSSPWNGAPAGTSSGASEMQAGSSKPGDAPVRTAKPFTFGAYQKSEAGQSTSPFTFSAQRSTTTSRVEQRSTFAFGSREPATSARTNGNQDPPFSFGSFQVPQDGFARESPNTASFFTEEKSRRSASLHVDGKTPQRQKDLHRAAKRRVSGGSVKSNLSSFGGSPASMISTPTSGFSPFAFASPKTETASSGKVPGRKLHSPMDIEMDENASTGSFSAFSFDSPKSATTPAPPIFSFGAPPSGSTETANLFRVNPLRTQPQSAEAGRQFPRPERKKSGLGWKTAAATGSNDSSTQPPAFVFGSSGSGVFTERFRVQRDSKSASFSFGSQTARETSFDGKPSADDAPAVAQVRSTSFSFETAFKEDDTRNMSGGDKADSKSSRVEGTSFFAFGKDQSSSRESLEVRLARRKQAREAKAELDPNPAIGSTRPVGAQKSLFQSRSESATRVTQPSNNNRTESYFTMNRDCSPVAFDQNGEAKRTTNVFQKPSSMRANSSSRSSNPSSSSNAWSFKAGSSVNADQPGTRGAFTFGATSAAEPEPNPSPPPVDNLKSNFDGFNIGAAPKGVKSKSSRTKPGRPGVHSPRVQPSKISENHRSAFKTSDSDMESGSNGKSTSFTTPPADPFVTPVFGQKRNIHNGVPVPEPENLSSVPSPFSPTHPSHNHSIPVFRKNNSFTGSTQESEKKAQPSDSDKNDARTTSVDFSGFSLRRPGTAFLPGRRILRAARPSQQPRAQPRNAAPGESTSSEETHRGWSEWKSLGGSAYTKRDYQEAADCYLNSIFVLENLLADKPELKTDQILKDKAKLHSNRAAALMMLLQLADAQRECYLSIESDPGYTRAYMRLGRIQVMLGDIEGASESATTAKQLLSVGGPNRRNEVSDSAGIQKIEVAVAKLEKLRGEIKWCLDVHDYSSALSHLQEALAVAPHCRSLQTQKAHALFEQKNYSQVIEYCTGVIKKQRAIDRNSDVPATPPQRDAATMEDNEVAMLGIELSMLRIRALHCENKVDDAMRHMQKLEVAAPCSSKVIQLKRLLSDMKELKHQANDFFKRGDYDQAQQVYSQALQLDPSNDEYCAVIYCNRAAALMGLQQYENALHDCNAALRRKARYPRCLLRRARCNVALKRYAAAIVDFDHFLKEHPSDSASSAASREVDLEKQKVLEAIEKEAQERKRKEDQQKKERQKGNGRSKPQQHQQRRHSGRHAWDDSKFYDDFWRSSSNAGSGSRQQSSGARGSSTNVGSHAKPRRTHYEVLGVVKSATQDEIKKAYRKLALLHHPDKSRDSTHADLFKDMTAAYNVLSDPASRSTYDREIQYSGFGRYNEY